MVDTKEFLRRKFQKIASGRPVRWTDQQTSVGDFDGRDWTVEIFDVPASERRDLRAKLWPAREHVRHTLGAHIRFVFHTSEATDKYYRWVRSTPTHRLVDSARTNVPRFSMEVIDVGNMHDVLPVFPTVAPRVA